MTRRNGPARDHAHVLIALAPALWLGVGVGAGCGDGSSQGREQTTVARHRDQADQCFAQGRYGCAMKAFYAALRIRPRDPELLNRFAMAARLRYYVTGEADYRDQELAALQHAVAKAPGQAILQVNLGTTYWELGRRERAAQAYRRALQIDPNHPDAALMRARIQRSTPAVDSTKTKE